MSSLICFHSCVLNPIFSSSPCFHSFILIPMFSSSPMLSFLCPHSNAFIPVSLFLCFHSCVLVLQYDSIILLLFSQDTLTESGHTMEESEELVGKVMSIIGSTDHFITQSLLILEGVRIMNIALQLCCL